VKKLRARLASVNRFYLAVGIGLGFIILLLFVLGFVWHRQVFGPGWKQSFYIDLLTSVTFFGLVGLAAFVQQINAPRGDTLRKRVEYLFATRNFSAPLIDYIEKLVKTSAMYSANTNHTVEVLEYRTDLKAYRIAIHNAIELRNMFGDWNQDEVIPFNFAPDMISDELDQLGAIVSLRIENGGQTDELLTGPLDIPADGVSIKVPIRLKPEGEATVHSEHWSWCTNVGNSGFSIKRFSEQTQVIVRNKSNVTVRVYRPDITNEIHELTFGQEVILWDETRVPERERLEIYWSPPLEYPEPGDPPENPDVHPILRS
jgi:hypothetical protein